MQQLPGRRRGPRLYWPIRASFRLRPYMQWLGLIALLAIAFICSFSKTPVPADPTSAACSLPLSEFQTWAAAGATSPTGLALDGAVKPADGIQFPNQPNCSFYKWSEQMFLWATSPAPPSYGGGGGRIFNSPVFYDVSPLDANHDRTLIPHSSGL